MFLVNSIDDAEIPITLFAMMKYESRDRSEESVRPANNCIAIATSHFDCATENVENILHGEDVLYT